MTSFFGFSLSGAVCITVTSEEFASTTVEKLAREGFERLFGEVLRLEHRIKFNGQSWDNLTFTESLSVAPYLDGGLPHEVARWFCLDKRDLQTVDELAATVDGLRSTLYGKWVFREWDTDRLLAAREAARAAADPCPCE